MSSQSPADAGARRPRRSLAVRALVVVLTLEAALVALLTATLLIELVIATPSGAAAVGTAVALTVITAAAAGWLVAIVIGVIRGRAWTRAAGIVWQVLQAAVGLGALQGAFAEPLWGWSLLAASLIGFLLLVSPPVGDALGVDRR